MPLTPNHKLSFEFLCIILLYIWWWHNIYIMINCTALTALISVVLKIQPLLAIIAKTVFSVDFAAVGESDGT